MTMVLLFNKILVLIPVRYLIFYIDISKCDIFSTYLVVLGVLLLLVVLQEVLRRHSVDVPSGKDARADPSEGRWSDAAADGGI